MIDALIDDEDVEIIKPSSVANNGEMVVAWLKEEQETTLKKFYAEGSRVGLQPANRSAALRAVELGAGGGSPRTYITGQEL
mgnify:CR=1 FL=1